MVSFSIDYSSLPRFLTALHCAHAPPGSESGSRFISTHSLAFCLLTPQVYDTNTHLQIRTISRYPPVPRSSAKGSANSSSKPSVPSGTGPTAAAGAGAGARLPAVLPEGRVSVLFGNNSRIFISWPDCIKVGGGRGSSGRGGRERGLFQACAPPPLHVPWLTHPLGTCSGSPLLPPLHPPPSAGCARPPDGEQHRQPHPSARGGHGVLYRLPGHGKQQRPPHTWDLDLLGRGGHGLLH